MMCSLWRLAIILFSIELKNPNDTNKPLQRRRVEADGMLLTSSQSRTLVVFLQDLTCF